MAKKLAILMLVLIFAVSAFTFAETNTDQELYDSIIGAEKLTLDEVDAKISGIAADHEGLAALQQDVADMKACSGTYIQINKYSDTEKTYTAEVSYYYEYGVPYCTVDYNNYSGTLDVAPVERSEEEDYLFITRPSGTFYSRSHEFTIRIGVENMRIQWADDCDYILDRGSGAESDLDPVKIPFVETERYTTITNALDNVFANFAKNYVYDEETKTLYAYVSIEPGLKNKLQKYPGQLEETWQNIIDTLLPYSEKVSSALELATRDGIMDISRSSFTIMLVDMLNATNSYDSDDILCIITDGTLKYNIMDDILDTSSPSNNTPGYSASIGERNALKTAKQYLEVFSFSYDGLVDQLEYEGYTHQQAVYAVNNCGANWYEQAAKKAKSYLDFSSFSYTKLIDQLEYDGFTYDQAVYGARQNGY